MAAVINRVDAGALAASVKNDAHARIGETLVSVFRSCRESGIPLNDLQQSRLIDEFSSAFDGFERAYAREIVSSLTGTGVEVWGFSDHLSDHLAGDHVG
ncbi:MAG: hypothetical protein H0X39_13970 [Actinobacteria bacterium]|nr:hypothetical protein [Actinomycetota bacterium]